MTTSYYLDYLSSLLGSLSILGWVSSLYMICFLFDRSYRRDGRDWPFFKNLKFWKYIANYFKAKIVLENGIPLNPKQQYIFASFPHGACSTQHILTMTDACGMLSDIYPSPRRDLCASILFYIPILKDILLFLGNVDASSKTAHYNLKKHRSLLIFVGGEKEQLMTKPRENKIYLKSRKGFIKLSLQYGAHLVPMWAFGENECYHVSNAFQGFRVWLQRNFKIGIPIVWGVLGSPLPLPVHIGIEMGQPIEVTAKGAAEITDKDIDELHARFMQEMTRLFERTKLKYGYAIEDKLEIH